MGSIIRFTGTVFYSPLYVNARQGLNGLKYVYSEISVIVDSPPGNTKNQESTRSWKARVRLVVDILCLPCIINCMHKPINWNDPLSKIHCCIHWHINSHKVLLCLCVLFYSSIVYTCVCVFVHIQSPLECRSIRSGASGLTYYFATLVCVSEVTELLAMWWYNKPKTKYPRVRDLIGFTIN